MTKLSFAWFLQDVHVPGLAEMKNFIDAKKFNVDLWLDPGAGLVYARSLDPDKPKVTRCYATSQLREALLLEAEEKPKSPGPGLKKLPNVVA
jgi:hypothetical protein